MNNRNVIRDRFKEYLDRKFSPNRGQTIVYSSSRKNNQSSSIYKEIQNYSLEFSQESSIDSSLLSQSNSSHKGELQNNNSSLKIKSMKKRLRKLRDIQENVCSICLQPFNDRVQMSCKHSYCAGCLHEWLKSSSKCPYCRTECSYYVENGQKYKIQQKQFIYEPPEQMEQVLDFQCYMCEQTKEGDEVLICDQCSVYACHINCDQRLMGVVPNDDEPWYCHFCS